MEDYVLQEIGQILRTAIREEEATRNRYLRGAEISLTGEIQNLFRMLAEEESRHIEKLQVLLKALEENRLEDLSNDLSLRGLHDIC